MMVKNDTEIKSDVIKGMKTKIISRVILFVLLTRDVVYNYDGKHYATGI